MALSGRMASPSDYSTTTSAGVDYGRRRLRLLKGAVTNSKVHRSSLAASPTASSPVALPGNSRLAQVLKTLTAYTLRMTLYAC